MGQLLVGYGGVLLRTFAVVAMAVAMSTAAGTLVSPEASASTHHRYSASLRAVHASITAGEAPKFAYTFTLPRRSRRLLQEQFGSAHVWKTVKVIKRVRHTGGVIAPKLKQLGYYSYRVVGVKDRKTVAASRTVHIKAYGTVSLHALCLSLANREYRNCKGGNREVGGNLWHWDMVIYKDDTYDGEYPNYGPVMKRSATSCRTMSLQFIPDDAKQVTLYIKLVQAATNLQTAQSSPGALGSANLHFDGGPFALKDSYSGPYYEHTFYYSGSATCYTANGRV